MQSTPQRITYQDFLRTGQGTIAGRYMRTFWQPVHRAQDLPAGRAKPIKIMSEDLTLYRGESGTPHLVAFRCAHRGTQLSTGWVEGDDLRCFYHGWKYDGSGQCVEQPAEPEPFCQRIRIRGYPTQEYLGLIFAYLGEGDPPPFPYLPEYDNDYFHEIWTGIWPCNYFTQIDNAVDTLHTTFAHWQFGRGVQTLDVREMEFGLGTFPSGPGAGFPNYFHMPNTHEWGGPPPTGEVVWNYTRGWRVPMDDYHHIRFDLHVVPLRGEEAEAYRARQRAGWKNPPKPSLETALDILHGEASSLELREGDRPDLINVQDLIAQVGLGPIADQPINEHLGRSDVGVSLLRRLWTRELQALARGEALTQWKRPDTMWEAIWSKGGIREPAGVS